MSHNESSYSFQQLSLGCDLSNYNYIIDRSRISTNQEPACHPGREGNLSPGATNKNMID